jgi:hypothetical protein
VGVRLDAPADVGAGVLTGIAFSGTSAMERKHSPVRVCLRNPRELRDARDQAIKYGAGLQ